MDGESRIARMEAEGRITASQAAALRTALAGHEPPAASSRAASRRWFATAALVVLGVVLFAAVFHAVTGSGGSPTEVLQAQLEGTENRINVARMRFNQAVEHYNGAIRRLPASLVASLGDFERKAYFQVTEGAARSPGVAFE